MAKKSAKKAGGNAAYTNGNTLFARLDVSGIRLLIQRLFPVMTTGAQRRVNAHGVGAVMTNCIMPDHQDDTPSLLIDCGRGFAQCFGATCNYHSKNLLKLLQDATGWSYKEVVTQIHTATGMRVVTGRAEAELNELDKHQLATVVAMQACNEHMQRCVNPPDHGPYVKDYSPVFLQVVQHTLDWFFVQRGRDPAYIQYLPYGMLPSQEMLTKFCVDILKTKADEQLARGITTFTPEYREDVMKHIESMFSEVDASWVHCITFHTGYGLTTPGRIRLRKPSDDKDDGTRTLPGFNEDDPVGFFGLYLPSYRTFTMRDIADMAFVVQEGEHDTLSLAEGALRTGKVGVRFLGAIGTHNPNALDQLASAGISRVLLYGDEPSPDYGKGEDWCHYVLGTSSKVEARVFTGWPLLKEGMPKDPDEAVRIHGFDKVYDLLVGPNARFTTAEKWAVDRVREKTFEYGDDDVREKVRWALHYGKCVQNPISFAIYLDQVSKLLGIPPGPLRQEITKTSFTEEGYIARLADVLNDQLHKVYREEFAHTPSTLFVFHKASRLPLNLNVVDGRGMTAQLATVFGPMLTFYRDYVGLPPALDDANLEDVSLSMNVPEKLLYLSRYLEVAMQHVVYGVPAHADCKEFRQGPWYESDPQRPGTKCLYVLNGDRLYKGTWRAGACEEPALDWVELSGPSDGKNFFVFDATARWSEEINSVADLEEGNSYTRGDLRRAADGAYKLLKLWKFKNQDNDARLLSYALVAMAATQAFETKSLLHFQGETQSGKSSLMAVFGGTKFVSLKLLEAAVYKADYSAAFVQQQWNNCALAMLLDEFEAEVSAKSRRGQHVEGVSEMVREMTTAHGSDSGRGTQDGRGRHASLHTNGILGSILTATLSQDKNRRVAIEIFEKEKGSRPPHLMLDTLFQPGEYASLRRILTLGTLKYTQLLANKVEDLRMDMSDTSRANYPVPSRFTDNILPAITCMALVGEDYDTFLRDLFSLRKASLLEMAEDTASSSLFYRITSTPAVTIGPNMLASVGQLISNPDQVTFLNSSYAGAFYDEGQKLLVIDWYVVTAPNGLLHKTEEYRGMSPLRLKHVLDNHPDAIRGTEFDRLNIHSFLQNLGHGGNKHAVSVLDVNSFVARMRTAMNIKRDIGDKGATVTVLPTNRDVKRAVNQMDAPKVEPPNTPAPSEPEDNI